MFVCFYIPVNSYGHVDTDSSPNWPSLTERLTRTLYTYFRLQQPYLTQRKEVNDLRNYFTINLHENMGPAGIKLPTPGSAVRLATNCATGPISVPTDCAMGPEIMALFILNKTEHFCQ